MSATGHLERDDLESLIAASRGDDQLQVSMSATEGEARRFDVVITLSLGEA